MELPNWLTSTRCRCGTDAPCNIGRPEKCGDWQDGKRVWTKDGDLEGGPGYRPPITCRDCLNLIKSEHRKAMFGQSEPRAHLKARCPKHAESAENI